MSLDLVTLALAKKYADEKVSGGSHGEYATKEYVDEAIAKANKKNLKHFFDVLCSNRYDEEDMIILREKDFEA